MRVWNRRDKRIPATAVYVGRGTPWGNPFVIGKHGDRDQVCDRFEREVLPALDLTPLRGRHLSCWCAPLRCHADALLWAANSYSGRRSESRNGTARGGARQSGAKRIAQTPSPKEPNNGY
jgi:hypothetical protein